MRQIYDPSPTEIVALKILEASFMREDGPYSPQRAVDLAVEFRRCIAEHEKKEHERTYGKPKDGFKPQGFIASGNEQQEK